MRSEGSAVQGFLSRATLPAQGRRRTRVIRTIDGFRLLAAMSVAVAVMTVRAAAVVVGRIVGAGTEK